MAKTYSLKITMTIAETNAYGDRIESGAQITAEKKLTANSLTDLGKFLQQLDEVGK